MQTFKFSKMHGAGNDYIYVNCFKEKVENINETAKAVSDRHFGIGSDGLVLNMGSPELVPKNIPIDSNLDRFISEDVEVDGKVYKVTGVSMGNPHAVTFIDDTDSLEIEKIGPKFETHKLFPKKINTEFAQIVDRNTIKMRVWERGAGETLACGTGACATMVAANLNGLVDDEADLVLLGGTLHIKWDKNENKVYMTGPAKFVFDGTITI